jgi:hypothetical protein
MFDRAPVRSYTAPCASPGSRSNAAGGPPLPQKHARHHKGNVLLFVWLITWERRIAGARGTGWASVCMHSTATFQISTWQDSGFRGALSEAGGNRRTPRSRGPDLFEGVH